MPPRALRPYWLRALVQAQQQHIVVASRVTGRRWEPLAGAVAAMGGRRLATPRGLATTEAMGQWDPQFLCPFRADRVGARALAPAAALEAHHLQLDICRR